MGEMHGCTMFVLVRYYYVKMDSLLVFFAWGSERLHFSHNFGHGYANLCSVFGMLLMLAFFIDQVQELCCPLFKAARAKFKSRTSLWEKIRGMFKEYLVDSWDDMFNAIAYGRQNPTKLMPNTS